jgi:hypothetical protein
MPSNGRPLEEEEKIFLLCVDTVKITGLRKHEMRGMKAAMLEGKEVSCKPRAVAVDVPAASSGSSYYPQCVTARRCGGCCNSALLECRPVNTTTVKKWVSTAETKLNSVAFYADRATAACWQSSADFCG